MSSKEKEKDADGELQTAKGMRDILGEEWLAYQGFLEKAAELAIYYGFRPLETPILERASLFERGTGADTDIVSKEMYLTRTRGGDTLALRPEFTPSVMRAYLENGLQAEPQPVMLYSSGPLFRHDRPQRGRYRQFYQFNLDALGTAKAVTDALIIKLLLTTLGEAGLKNLRLEINSLGDRECRPIFRRELANYYRKHARELCEDCRERLKTNPLRLLDCKNPKCQALKEAAPESVGYLCAACKSHFREVLEHLEMLAIPYEINHQLVRGLDYYTRTVFEIFDPTVTNEVGAPLALAGGGRYDYLARALGYKKEVPAVGGAIGLERMMLSPHYRRQPPRIIKKPKIFFIQLSFDAKLKAISVIEILRQARIPMAQSIAKDSLGTQLGLAEKLAVPHTIILGQKEALENTVIVRDMQNRSQEVVPLAKLADYLRVNIKHLTK